MKTKFINHHQDQLILFFNGWGMDEAVVSHLESSAYDILIFYHYNSDFSFDSSILKSYKKVYLVAWSMGVWASVMTMENLDGKFNKSIAINGTLQPVDDIFGINRAIFKGTIEHFSERNKQKFDRRMMATKLDFQSYQSLARSRTLEDQLEELKEIYTLALKKTTTFAFDKAVIGKKDLIFTERNQNNFWQNKVEIIQKDWAHFPFFNVKTWKSIIDL